MNLFNYPYLEDFVQSLSKIDRIEDNPSDVTIFTQLLMRKKNIDGVEYFITKENPNIIIESNNDDETISFIFTKIDFLADILIISNLPTIQIIFGNILLFNLKENEKKIYINCVDYQYDVLIIKIKKEFVENLVINGIMLKREIRRNYLAKQKFQNHHQCIFENGFISTFLLM